MMKAIHFQIILILLGVVLLGIGGYLDSRAIKFINSCTHTEGKVIDLVEDNRDSNMKAPVVTFKTKDGEQLTFRTYRYSTLPEFSIGDKVDVIYLTENPGKTAKINSFLDTRGLPLTLYIFGAALLIIGIAFVFLW